MYVCVYVCVRGPARFLSGRSLLYFSIISFSKAKFILYEKPQQAKGEKNTHTHTCNSIKLLCFECKNLKGVIFLNNHTQDILLYSSIV